MAKETERVILGIGNPGLRYKFSRHNLGFLVVERLAQENRVKIKNRDINYLFATVSLGGRQVLLVKPETFVNLSGQTAALLLKQHRMALKDLLVVCDDVNLPLGRVRIRSRGSDGGHQGLRSIIQTLSGQDFPRLRIGVDVPGSNRPSGLSKYVLARFNRKETRIVKQAIEQACNCCRIWLSDGVTKAMNQFN